MYDTCAAVTALLAVLAGGRVQDVSAAQPPQAVSLAITVDRRLFAVGATLDVDIWNATQIAALNNNARCGVVRDVATGEERITCPDGVIYQPVTPERVRVPLGASDVVDVTIRSVKPGESFQVQIRGPSRDGCNTTSATLVHTARSGRNSLEDIHWQTTARACAKGEQQ